MTFRLGHALIWAEKRRKEESLGLPQYSLRINPYSDILSDDDWKEFVINNFGKHACPGRKQNAPGGGQ